MPTSLSSLQRVEAMKKQLIKLANQRGISHPDVIKYSQKLDKELNKINNRKL